MQLNDFYILCDGDHREFFSALIGDWQEAGFICQGDQHGMVLGMYSLTAQKMMPCFYLRAGGADVAMIRLEMPGWQTSMGYEYTSKAIRGFLDIEGLKHQQRMDVFYIENPGHALPQVQKALRNYMHTLAIGLQKKFAP